MSSNLPGFFQGTDMPTAGWWEALWPDPADVLAKVGVRRGMEVVDLCSGDGWFTLHITKVARHVVAIDIDPDLLDVSRHRLSESGVTNCDYVAGDAYDLAKLALGNTDFVFLANAFHGVPDRRRLVLAVQAVLKPGGFFSSPPARGNAGIGRTARTKNGIEIVTGTDHRGRRIDPPEAGSSG
jgi:ubiquinone/menaquinone biosynthesis C-methylase UbiE